MVEPRLISNSNPSEFSRTEVAFPQLFYCMQIFCCNLCKSRTGKLSLLLHLKSTSHCRYCFQWIKNMSYFQCEKNSSKYIGITTLFICYGGSNLFYLETKEVFQFFAWIEVSAKDVNRECFSCKHLSSCYDCRYRDPMATSAIGSFLIDSCISISSLFVRDQYACTRYCFWQLWMSILL